MTYQTEILIQQLGALGRDLEHEVAVLAECEEDVADSEFEYRQAADLHEDALALAWLSTEGTVEMRKATARLECTESRAKADLAYLTWSKAKARLRTQQANLQALHRRVEIGRSMLSREKALISLAGTGET